MGISKDREKVTMANNDLVRPSRDGDQFHYHWAARQCLALLPGSGDLASVTIEGPSARESDDEIEEGVDLIDVGLYYGTESLNTARYVRYIQLKHSTRQVVDPWTASGLSKTVRGFTKRYKKLLEQFSASELKRKFHFEFTTNRPIDSKLSEALADLANAEQPRHPSIHQTLSSYSVLSEVQNSGFFSMFSVEGGEPGLWAQRNLLSQDIAAYLADADYDAPVQLKELITRKASSEFEKDPAIRRHDVLRTLKVSELELLPAPCQIIQLQHVLPREQEREILKTILHSTQPVIIHADGGVGKSILAQRLSASMPDGSESVLYDCFGDGLYRNALNYRHRHRDALVQLSNELSARGLCHPLIPSSHADAKQYMQAFCGRLTQAIGILRARIPEANLCLFIDAADNADMAAEELNECAFVRDLVRTPLPCGVRLVLTCRSHRRYRLNAPPGIHEFELKPFNEDETAVHLRAHYPAATQGEVSEFAFLSSSNPRVQALAFERQLPMLEMLRELGPEPTSVEQAIGDLLQRAVNKLKDRAGVESDQIDLICQGLAILRPLIPVAVLAKISGTSESAVRSFALDLGRPLFVKGNSLHFLDEPAETWFRETFKPDTDGLNQFLKRLRPLANESSYVASTLPQILLAAERLEELILLAISDDGLPTAKPLERRDVELQRLMFALKACLEQGLHLPAAKIALKAAGETAGESRQTKLIQENTDIAAILLPADRINELVSRRTFDSTWMGSHHAYDAGLLSGIQEFTAEATSRLRMAMDWLYAWARSTPDDLPQENVTDPDRAELALVLLRLQGPQAATSFLRRWRSRNISLTSGKLVARRLIDLNEHAQLDALAYAANNDVWLLLGIAAEIAPAGRSMQPGPLSRLIRLLGDRRVKLPESSAWDERWQVLYAVQAALSLAMQSLPPACDSWGRILRRYLPESPPTFLSDSFRSDYVPMVRAYALEAELRGHELSLMDIAPVDVQKDLKQAEGYRRNQQTRTFQRQVGGVLPWIVLSIKTSCGRPPPNLDECIAAAIKASESAESKGYERDHAVSQTAVVEWLKILRDASAVSPQTITALQSWISSRELPLWPDTLTKLCHIAARIEGLTDLSLDFAFAAYDVLEPLRDEAETRTNSYVSLARAILPASPAEANAYFSRAVEIASRIGDENLSRWSAILSLGKAASSDVPRPQSAYRLSRVAELTYEYVARDKHFDWAGTVEALVCLCPSSTLTILSRWRDRRFGSDARLLPISIYLLMERGFLPAITPIALAGIQADWSRLDDLKRILKKAVPPFEPQLVAQIAYRYIRLQRHSAKTWEELTQISDELGIEFLDVKRLSAFSKASDASEEPAASTWDRGVHEPVVQNTPQWQQFFDGVDMASSSALRAAYGGLKSYDTPYEFEEFFFEGTKRVGLGSMPAFIQAVGAWADFGTFELRYLLNAIPDSAFRMLSLRAAVREAVLCVCRREPENTVRRGWNSYLPFERLANHAVVSDRDIVEATLEGYATHIETLSADGLFQLIDPLVSSLSSAEADEVLNFGLDLLEDALRPEDGDGSWCEDLRPPRSCIDAVAGYLWVGLGSPVVATRWEFAHAIRTCVELGWLDLLSALARWPSSGAVQSFIDHGLVFYEWHARQWLLIGLRRGARENPEGVIPFLSFLEECLAEEHVLLRAFAAQTLRLIPDANGSVVAAYQNLDSVNAPCLPMEVYSDWNDLDTDENALDALNLNDDEKYHFGIDIGPYWLAPLGSVFGITQIATERRAMKVLRERLNASTGKWSDDARYARKIFGERETIYSHGGMPTTEDLRAYQAYHAMMIVASRLLEQRAVRQAVDDTKNDFDDWIQRHLLTRPDGCWLADRVDPLLVSEPPPKAGYFDNSWCWSVSSNYLDQQLLSDDGLHVFWGDWRSGERDKNEIVSIRSARVSRNGANALLAALQTALELNRFSLPCADHHEDLKIGNFSLKGWVVQDGSTARLDEYDPWAVGMRYPAIVPCFQTITDLALDPSVDGRRWSSEFGGHLRSETWTHVVGYGREQDTIAGTRLSGNTELVQLLLQQYPDDCLLISVSVQRLPSRDSSKNDGVELYPHPYVRYYLMDSDATSRPL